jgi:hypothetical protein
MCDSTRDIKCPKEYLRRTPPAATCGLDAPLWAIIAQGAKEAWFLNGFDSAEAQQGVVENYTKNQHSSPR